MPIKINSISTIGLVGFGAFGRLLAQHLAPHARLRIHDPHQLVPADPAGRIVQVDAHGAAACDIVVLAVPVDQLHDTIADLRPHLKPGVVVLDVGSVKLGPVETMRALLPDHVEIIGTHPLFGPQSARNGIKGLKIALCPIRGESWRRIAAFLRRMLELDVIVTTPDAHDRDMALVQGLTHLVAKILVRMEPMPNRLTTRSFELLMQATEMVRHDAAGVFLAIERANPHAQAVRERFFTLAEEMRRALDHTPPAPIAKPLPASLALIASTQVQS
jgi:prephenate dehydrogenase